ncbi:hypothetical protein MIN45_P1675 [Methylomarinovum tepidoasis]|uniref:DUF5658 domain-containing protein n=1 Tax=Methylomarinovum tepidoasis TaxID=2840183 RepID=A0AAU9CGE6_9GAMM|nr:DUF5658 family protein [Methylomarinovum sp. IN45]BCX89303.1 hypothetical protein MIN45_P1675 [Methylomarinovum sp. IN45]
MTDRRRQPERRRLGWRTFWYALIRGRRRGPRRAEEQDRPHYVDYYEDHRLLLWSLGIVAACALDALLTLMILARGGIEINPLMRLLLELGTYPFFYVKYLGTSLAVIFVLLHHRHRLLNRPATSFLPLLFGVYALLIGYEWWLLSA